MTDKSKEQANFSPTKDEALNAFNQLQDAGLGNMMDMGKVWIETFNAMGAEVASFVADRIREDLKTQHEILQCKNVADLQHIQSQFIRNAVEQYQAETGKLVELATDAFSSSIDQPKD